MLPVTSRAFAARRSAASLLVASSRANLLHTSAVRQTGENRIPANVKPDSNVPVTEDAKQEELRVEQAPNRKEVWSRSQQPRSKAMSGPRFEQTDIEAQPRPLSAMELIHKQPVRWTDQHVVACDGGGGPLGHPRIFINVDKPQICQCTYCGLPFANTHHRKHLESLPSTTYPLDPPSGDPAVVEEPMKVTDEPLAQR